MNTTDIDKRLKKCLYNTVVIDFTGLLKMEFENNDYEYLNYVLWHNLYLSK